MTKSGGRPRGPIVLLTNDDGFFSDGINALARSIGQIADCFIVAPDREKSATSLALTLHHPLRAQKIRPLVYAVDGTPADGIYVAIQKLLPGRPDLIISGINHGPNLGQQDISYSGTVAGAVQGTSGFSRPIYRGPAPPPGKPHHYHFTVYAIDATLDLRPGLTKAELLEAIDGHIVGKGELVAIYERKPPP